MRATARAPWPKIFKMATIAAYAGMVASLSMLYMIYSMPDWLTTLERPLGAPSTTRELTDTAQALEVVAWSGILGTGALLAMLLLAVLVVSLRPASGASGAPLATR